MLKTYLDTTEYIWMDEKGVPWPDNSPEMIVGGQEEIEIILVTASDDRGMVSANPEEWPRDTSWADMSGISAMLTMDNDSMAKLKGTLDADVSNADTAITGTFSGISDASSIPQTGYVNIFSANGQYESIAYSTRDVVGKKVTFHLDNPVVGNYPANTTVVDCKEAPLAEAFLNAEKSDFGTGKLSFTFSIDSYHLRAIADYANTASIAIRGVELLFYTVATDGVIQKKRAYVWDTVALRNSMGNPGFEAELPDAYKDQITIAAAAAASLKLVETDEGGYLNLYCEPGNYYKVYDVQLLSVSLPESASTRETVIWVELSSEENGGGSISFPTSLQWVGEPSFEAGKTYLISIVNGIAVAAEVTV